MLVAISVQLSSAFEISDINSWSMISHACRISISDLGIPVKPFFNSAAKVLSLNPIQDTSTDAGQARSNCPDQRRSGFGRGNGNGSSSGGDAQDTSAPDYATWLASLPPVLNPHCIPPVQLPLHISALTQLPVVVTAVSRPGQLSELIVRIYLGKQELAAAVAELAGDEAEAAQKLQELGDHVVEGAAAQALLSCEAAVMASIPWGEQLND